MSNMDNLLSSIEEEDNNDKPKITKLQNDIKNYTRASWIFIAAGVAVAIFGIVVHLNPSCFGSLNLNELGDFLGGSVASLWSLAGLFLIYVAFLGQKLQLIHQQIELRLSRVEIIATRYELKGQKEQFIKQNFTLSQQRFENTFFSLLETFNNLIAALGMDGSSGRKHLSNIVKSNIKIAHINDFGAALSKYNNTYSVWEADLGHYFRTLYCILQMVDVTATIKNKTFYIGIIRAQLSRDELTLLFFEGLSDRGISLKHLITKYGLMKNIQTSDIVKERYLNEYKKAAYADNI